MTRFEKKGGAEECRGNGFYGRQRKHDGTGAGLRRVDGGFAATYNPRGQSARAWSGKVLMVRSFRRTLRVILRATTLGTLMAAAFAQPSVVAGRVEVAATPTAGQNASGTATPAVPKSDSAGKTVDATPVYHNGALGFSYPYPKG